MQNEFNLRKKRGVGEVISDSFSYYRIHFIQLMKVLLVIPTPFLIVGAIFYGLFYKSVFQNIGMYNTTVADTDQFLMYTGLLFLSIGSILVSACIVEYMKLSEHTNKEDISFKQILTGLKKNALYYFLGSILIYIIVVLGTILLILPGIFLAIVFSVYYFTIGVENKDPGAAITRSFQLVWGNWWKSFGIYLLMYLIIGAIVGAIVIPISIIAGLTNFSSNNPEMVQQGMGNFMTILMPIIILLSTLIGSLFFITTGINYYSLAELLDETGLKQRIQAIEKDKSNDSSKESD